MSNLIQNPCDLIKGKLTKDVIDELSARIVSGVEAGLEDPLKVLVKIEFLKKVAEDARKKIQDHALEAVGRYEANSANIFGVLVTQKEAAPRYDYTQTKAWNELKAAEDEISTERKDLEKVLKAMKEKRTEIDEETGEIIELFPPVKSSTTTVAVQFKKD